MPKRILSGTVVSDKNDQTITVQVERRYTHPVMKKTVRSSKKYRAHDPQNAFKVGDQVRIQECAPRSKSKRWEVVAQAEAHVAEGKSLRAPAKSIGVSRAHLQRLMARYSPSRKPRRGGKRPRTTTMRKEQRSRQAGS